MKVMKRSYANGGQTDPPKKKKLTAQQERFIKDLAGKQLDAWMNPRDKDRVYGYDSKRVPPSKDMFTGETTSKKYTFKKGQTVGEAKKLYVENQGGREAYIESLIKNPKYRARLEKKLPTYAKAAKEHIPNIKIRKAKK